MTYARVGIWKVKSGSDRDELTGFLRDTVIPSYRQQPGFRSYFAVATGDDTAVGVQIWDNPDQAVKAGAQTGDQVRRRVGDRATLESWYHGPVAISIPEQSIEKAGYARIGIWDIAPNADHQEIIEKAREALIPMFQDVRGLVSFLVIETVEGRLVVAHTWETESQSAGGMQSGAEWLQETLANQLALVAGYDGPVGLAAGASQSG